MAGEIVEPAFALVALVDDPHRTVRAGRLAVRSGKPAADVLDPKSGFCGGVGPDAVLNVIADAAAFVALLRFDDGIEARLYVVGL